MLKTLFVTSIILILTLAGNVQAFLSPIDSHEGMSVEIHDFPDHSTRDGLQLIKVDPTEPLSIKVSIRNQRNTSLQGTLHLWLNDDWQVQGRDQLQVTVPPADEISLTFQAQAKSSILPALYPIHAQLKTKLDGHSITLHPIAIFEATPPPPAPDVTRKRLAATGGVVHLTKDLDYHTFYQFNQKNTQALGANFNRSDHTSGTQNQKMRTTRGGVARNTFSVHPPYKQGAGTTWMDFPLHLGATPATLTFHTAIRDSTPAEGGSDGTEHRVIVIAEGQEHELFRRFSDSKQWLPARVDLAQFAGRAITLRLWTGPGPNNNTSCDQCFWGDPMLVIGKPPTLTTAAEWQNREQTAIDLAQAAYQGKSPRNATAFTLQVHGQRFGAAIVLGPQGLTDGVMAFNHAGKNLVFKGFNVDLNQMPIGGVEGGQPVQRVQSELLSRNRWRITHHVAIPDGNVPVTALITTQNSALKIHWQIPGAQRDHRGLPRYTRLGLGPATQDTKLWRAYAGFGNVFENPGAFELHAGGFTLSTRHVGADYTNGLSLVQACDIFPERLCYAPALNHFTLESSHDATFMFIPAAQGAFAAARAYREVANFKASPGLKLLGGRMCLDQWGGDYAQAASDLREAQRYGLNDAIFVKHVWQHWGYDYRLPEIFPPAGEREAFNAMRQAAQEAGILFCPHDNYIDFYPDAQGFSYDHIAFTAEGFPIQAWYNQGRTAQSYRWLPHAFQPWMENNMRLMRDSFAPEALFIDVFTAIAPFDYYDRTGRFYPQTATQNHWGTAFATCRKILHPQGVMISEAGTDALIGNVDAVQSDHFEPSRWLKEYTAADRTPWHDMATHGRMVLFAGGLGHRYSALNWDQANRPAHGYGSDDYLSNTVLGGRNPMCDGPFSRRAVMTYWLLHDVCAVLARSELESHTFGDSIFQQHTTFSGKGRVWANRGTNQIWQIKAQHNPLPHALNLPRYGFYAETPQAQAGVVLIEGQRAAFAYADQSFFVDARPRHNPGHNLVAESQVDSGRYLGHGNFELDFTWQILKPASLDGYSPFLHICNAEIEPHGEHIVFQAPLPLTPTLMQQSGNHTLKVPIRIPAELPDGAYQVQYGLYKPGSERLRIGSHFTDSSRRIHGGTLAITKNQAGEVQGTFIAPKMAFQPLPETNIAGKILNFGAIATDGAFRLTQTSRHTWHLMPLPGSRVFTAELDLAALGIRRQITAVTQLEPFNAAARPPQWQQIGGKLRLTCDGHSWAYRLEF